MQQSLEKQLKDLFEIVEVRYLKKQKNKVDFMLEVKNMENNMKVFQEKIKELLAMNDKMSSIQNLIKIMNCEVYFNGLSTKHLIQLSLLQA